MTKVNLRTVTCMKALMMVDRLMDEGMEQGKAVELVSKTYLISQAEILKHLNNDEKKAA